jgi:hypothetical protein
MLVLEVKTEGIECRFVNDKRWYDKIVVDPSDVKTVERREVL